jgi:MFS family permease
MLVATCVLSVIAIPAMALSTALGIIGIARALEALATAAAVPALLGLLAAQAAQRPQRRGRLMAVFEASAALGLIAGPILGTALWDPLGRGAIALMALPYAAGEALFLGLREPPYRTLPRANALSTAWMALRRPAMRRIAPAWLVLNAVIGLWFTHAVYQMTSGRRMAGQFLQGTFSSGRPSLILLLYALTFSAGALGWGLILDRVGEWRTLRLALLGLLEVCAGLTLINHSAGEPLPFVAGVALYGGCLEVESSLAPAMVSY